MTNNITEAKRYLANAKEILSEKAGKEDGFYKDRKYVKLAGNAAYSGVLVAIDGLLSVKKKERKSVDWYQGELSKMDKKVLTYFNSAYDTLHLAMGYDGNLDAGIATLGLSKAETIINWVEQKMGVVE